MSAAALAKTRREAILKSRGDRLAKLTSSARGDDYAGVYARDDPPSTTQSGLKYSAGEETTLPISSNTSNRQSSPQPPVTDIPPLSNWGSEEQQQRLRHMLNGVTNREGPQFSPFAASNQAIPQIPEDPLSALFASMMGQDNNTFVPPLALVKPKTLLRRVLPLLHLLCMIGLLVWFVVWREPEHFAATIRREGGGEVVNVSKTFEWSRWAGLSKQSPAKLGLVVSPLPAFFWAFTTVELILHSIRLFTAPSEYQPPMLLSLILPYLSPQLSQTITTSMKYFHMASLVLDDLAILLLGMAVIVYVSGWTT